MPSLEERITVDPGICHGKPTVRGLRYPVSMILELLAGGMTREELLADYPDLEADDITACLAFAARLLNVHRIVPLAAVAKLVRVTERPAQRKRWTPEEHMRKIWSILGDKTFTSIDGRLADARADRLV